jgi:general secretion pathway protein K
MLPHLTLYSRQARPDPQFASAPVLTALGLDADTVLAQRAQQERDADSAGGATTLASSSGTYSIESVPPTAVDAGRCCRQWYAMARAGFPGGPTQCFAGSRE